MTDVATLIEPQLVTIPAGRFEMGATDDDKFANLLERPRHPVRIPRPFALGKHPITVAQYHSCVHADAEVDPALADLPISGVSWRDAAAFCDRLATLTGKPYRLPAEAEWEYACRAGTTTVFHTGNDITPAQANFLYDELGRVIGLGHPTPVGSYPPNAFGLCDMHGNVCELVTDHWHDGYTPRSAPGSAPADGSAWVDPTARHNHLRVIRGGSWDYLPRLLRAAYRDWIPEDRRLDHVGFRVAVDLP